MNKGLLTGFIVLVLLFLGIGFLTALNYSSYNKNQDYDYNNQYSNNPLQNNPDNSVSSSVNPCGSNQHSYLCFRDHMLQQEKKRGL